MKINVVQEAKFKALPVVELDEHDDDEEPELIEYRVQVTRNVVHREYDRVYITAENEDDAYEIAQDRLRYDPDSFDWEYCDTIDSDDYEVDDVEEV